MPQMSPINWLLLMMTIVFIFYLYMNMISDKKQFFVMKNI